MVIFQLSCRVQGLPYCWKPPGGLRLQLCHSLKYDRRQNHPPISVESFPYTRFKREAILHDPQHTYHMIIYADFPSILWCRNIEYNILQPGLQFELEFSSGQSTYAVVSLEV